MGSLETNFSEILIENLYISIQENTFENVVWKMAAILLQSRPQCVNCCLITGHEDTGRCSLNGLGPPYILCFKNILGWIISCHQSQ